MIHQISIHPICKEHHHALITFAFSGYTDTDHYFDCVVYVKKAKTFRLGKELMAIHGLFR